VLLINRGIKMPRPKVTRQLTTTQVARALGMNVGQVVSWITHGALPPPSSTDNNGVRYFDHEWLRRAREIVEVKKGTAANMTMASEPGKEAWGWNRK
jgi:hypothetical protein